MTTNKNLINIISDKDMFRLLERTKHTPKIARKAIENIIIPFPNFETSKFNDSLWSILKKDKYGHSYNLYIHTLRVCEELMLEYEHTEDLIYFNKAEEIIQSWMKFNNGNSKTEMMWYDHTTANRTQVLIHYIYLSQKLNKNIDYNLFFKTLIKHGEILCNDDIHHFNNHGLMMDRSLMILGNIINNKDFIEKGKSRALKTFWYSYSYQGIHLENSPQYHNMVTRMYNEIESYLIEKEDTLGTLINNYLALSKEYSKKMLKPDNTLLSVGDSGKGIQPDIKRYENIYDVEAGMAILQYKEPKPFYVSFTCGYSTIVHKHRDDLGITLNYNNKDFIVDPGPFNYSKNKIRKYMTSKEAHSSFYLKEFNYKLKKTNRFTRNISLKDYYDNNEFTLVKGAHHDYDGSSAKLTRILIQFKKIPILIIFDNVLTNVKHSLKFVQNFNLGLDVTIENLKDKIILTNEDTKLALKQFITYDNFSIVTGDKSVPVALNTTGFGKSKETNQLKFEKASNNQNIFLSALYDNDLVSNIKIEYEENYLDIYIDDENYIVYI